MIEIEDAKVTGWESAITGMRNPMNSWDRSDSTWCSFVNEGVAGDTIFHAGQNDLALMKRLVKAGSDHAKFMRFINVTIGYLVAPRFWFLEFDTYKIGTVSNSCSTMHRLHADVIDSGDFSCETLDERGMQILSEVVDYLNEKREQYSDAMEDGDSESAKTYWRQMIEILPQSYEQRRTVQLNYAVLRNMYHARRNHKLSEWRDFCAWIETLPYSELITE